MCRVPRERPRYRPRVNFEYAGDPIIADAIREYLYARLNIDLPGYKSRTQPVNVNKLFRHAFRFFSFQKTEQGICDPARIDQGYLIVMPRRCRTDGARLSSLILSVISTCMPIDTTSRQPDYGLSPGQAAQCSRWQASASLPKKIERRASRKP